MKLTFRQGVVRHQTDINGNPIFLQRSAANGQFVDLIISPTPTIIAFAHRVGTYLIEELKTVPQAWGPISSATAYLYWDVNLLTGVLTRGITLLPPLYTSSAPTTPQVDQHWFDTVENIFRVWNGTKWVEKVRCFAGHVTSGAILHPQSIGSQAGLVGEFEAGNIILDSFGMPLRQSNGCFVTTVTWLNVVNLGSVAARIDTAIMNGMAAEELPKMSLVQLQQGRRMVLARSTDYRTRVSGIVTEDLYEGEVSRIISTGVVRDSAFSFPDNFINRALFCGPTGQVTTTPPTTGVVQQIGFVYDKDAIFVNIQQPVILDDPDNIVTPPPTTPAGVPIANFTMSVTSGIAPLSVTFTNESVDADAVEWDFTNDGYVDTTTVNPTYTFASPGLYTVRLRASNVNGFDEEIKANVIQVSAPNVGPLNTNLGISFGAPAYVPSGSTFGFQVIVTNDGLADATNVLRQLKLRSSDGSPVTIINPPSGVVVTKAGPLTKVKLPLVDIASGNYATFNLQAQAAGTASAVQLEGVASSPETDPEQDDNKTSLTIGVRP